VPEPPPESGVVGKVANMFTVDAKNKKVRKIDFVFIKYYFKIRFYVHLRMLFLNSRTN
jgi:hypothetical protein